MRRLVLLLAAKRRGEGELEAALGEYAHQLTQLAQGESVRVGVQVGSDPLTAAATETGRTIAPVDALVEISSADVDDDGLVKLVSGAAAGLSDVVDADRSAVVLGAVHELTSFAPGPVELAVAARRLPSLTPEAFGDYWLRTHAPLALSLMPDGARDRIGYQQLHADADASRSAADSAGLNAGLYDGLLQVHMTTPEDFLSVAFEPSFAKAIYEDELNFADQSELRGAFLRMGC